MMSEKFVFETTEHDVLLGRGKNVNNRPGNIQFRKVAAERAFEYTEAERKGTKDELARYVVDKVRATGGRFLRHVTVSNAKGEHVGAWEVVPDDVVHTKAKQAMRDAASAIAKSQQNSSTAEPSQRQGNIQGATMYGAEIDEMARIDSTGLQNSLPHHQASPIGQPDMSQIIHPQVYPPLYRPPPLGPQTTISSQEEELLALINAQQSQNLYLMGQQRQQPQNLAGSSYEALNRLPQQQSSQRHILPPNTYTPSINYSSMSPFDEILNASLQQQRRQRNVMEVELQRIQREALLQQQRQMTLQPHQDFRQHQQSSFPSNFYPAATALPQRQQQRFDQILSDEELLQQHRQMILQSQQGLLQSSLPSGIDPADRQQRQPPQLFDQRLSEALMARQLANSLAHESGDERNTPTETSTKRDFSYGSRNSETTEDSIKRRRITNRKPPEPLAVVAAKDVLPSTATMMTRWTFSPQQERIPTAYEQQQHLPHGSLAVASARSPKSSTSSHSSHGSPLLSSSSSRSDKKPKARDL